MYTEAYRNLLISKSADWSYGDSPATLLLFGARVMNERANDKDAAIDAAPTIEVLSKEIIPARSSLLFRRDMGYLLIGEVEYFYDGEHRVEEIRVEVDKEIFDSVSIGDTFNKQTYTVVTEG